MGKCHASPEGNDEEGAKDVSAVAVAPYTPIDEVFRRVCASCGISDASSTRPYVTALRNAWHFRAYDLLEVGGERWDELAMPLVLKNELFELLERYRKSTAFIEFEDAPAAKHQDVREALDELAAANRSEETAKHVRTVREALESAYCCNVENLKTYLDEAAWNALSAPRHLKELLLRRVGHSLEAPERGAGTSGEADHGDADALFSDKEQLQVVHDDDEKQSVPDPTTPMEQLCELLAGRLWAEPERVRCHLSPLFSLQHRRLCHLALIRADVFAEAMATAPPCLKDALFDIVSATRGRCADPLPFYEYPAESAKKGRKRKKAASASTASKLRRLELDWTMRTDKAMSVLERDLAMAPGALAADCDVLMAAFHSTLWDWFLLSPSPSISSCPVITHSDAQRARGDVAQSAELRPARDRAGPRQAFDGGVRGQTRRQLVCGHEAASSRAMARAIRRRRAHRAAAATWLR